jgi:hypothetical protein
MLAAFSIIGYLAEVCTLFLFLPESDIVPQLVAVMQTACLNQSYRLKNEIREGPNCHLPI